MRWLKVAGIALGVLVLLAVGAGVALYFGGGEAVKWVLEHPGSTLIGREIKIGGTVGVHWGAPTRVVINDIHVANASWDSEHEMFAAKRLELRIFARTLIFAPTLIPVLRLDGAKLLLETSGDGEGNWKFGNGAPKKRTEFPHLQHFEVNSGELIYHNGKTKAESDLGVGHLALDDPDPDGAGEARRGRHVPEIAAQARRNVRRADRAARSVEALSRQAQRRSRQGRSRDRRDDEGAD